MNDKQLEFWTKPPNVFMVATTLIGKIVGCISYKQMTSDTVQMHRLRVDEKYRGQRIGRKLIQASLDVCTVFPHIRPAGTIFSFHFYSKVTVHKAKGHST